MADQPRNSAMMQLRQDLEGQRGKRGDILLRGCNG